jgi:signal transduction histidine kinase
LGLAISRRIIERMGGTLVLESSTPQGSVFVAQVPLARVALSAHAPPAPAHPADLSG